MPVILRHKGFRFFFWANEGNPREPLHIHVRKGGAIAKFWLLPEVRVAESYDLSPAELRELAQVVKDHKGLRKFSGKLKTWPFGQHKNFPADERTQLMKHAYQLGSSISWRKVRIFF